MGLMAEFLNFSSLLINPMESLRGLPNTISDGDTWQSGSGVFLSWSKPNNTWSVSRLPDAVVLALSSRFTDLTATSARPFDWGWYADEILCLTPHVARNFFVSLAVNSGPPSDDISSGTPKVAKNFLMHAIRPLAPELALPDGVEYISGQPDRRSPITR